MDYIEALNQRRSEYSLSPELPVSQDDVVKLIRDIISVTPTSYNGQSPRAFVLFGDDHKALWKIVEDSLVDKYSMITRSKKIGGTKDAPLYLHQGAIL